MLFPDPFEEDLHLEYKEKSQRKFDALKEQFSLDNGAVVKKLIQITRDYPNLPKSIATAMALSPVNVGAKSIAKVADMISNKQLDDNQRAWDAAYAEVENTEFVEEKMVDDFSINLRNIINGDSQLGVWGWAAWEGMTRGIRDKVLPSGGLQQYVWSLAAYDQMLEDGMSPEEAQAQVPIWVKDTNIPDIGKDKGAWGELKEFAQMWSEANDLVGESYFSAMVKEALKGNAVNYDRDRVMFTESLLAEGNPVYEKMIEQGIAPAKAREIFYEQVGTPIKIDEALGVQTYTSITNPYRVKFDPWAANMSPEGSIEKLMNMTGDSKVPGMTPADLKRGNLQLYTPGRYEAAQVAEPGTKAYNAISGTIDAGYNLVSEAGVGKIIKGLGQLGKAITTVDSLTDADKAAKISKYQDFFKTESPIDPSEGILSMRNSQIIRRGTPETRGDFAAGRRFYKEAGLFRGLRGTVFSNTAVDLINSPFGQKVTTALTNENNIAKLHSLPGIGDLDTADIVRIADSTDEATTVQILEELFNAKKLTELPGKQSALLNGALRQAAVTGSRLQGEAGVVKQGIGKVLSTIGNEDAAFKSIGSSLAGVFKQRQAINPAVNTGIDNVDTLFGLKTRLTAGWDPYWTSLLSLTPEMGMSLTNRELAVRQLIGHMQVVGYKWDEMQEPLRELLAIDIDDTAGVMNFSWEQILRDVGRVKEAGGNDLWVYKQARNMFNTGGDVRAYFVDAAGKEMPFIGDVSEEIVLRDPYTGKRMKALVPSVHLLAEMGDITAPLIDYRLVNRAMGKVFTQYGDDAENAFISTFRFYKEQGSKIKNIWTKAGDTPFMVDGQFKGFIPGKNITDDAATLTLDFITRNVFKPLVLLRGAWFVRVFLEESLRMSAAGLENMFAHPINYMMWVKSHGDEVTLLGKKKSDKMLRTISGRGEDTSKLLESEEYINATNSGWAASSLRGRPTGRGRQFIGKNWIRVSRGHAKYNQGLATELLQLRNDPIARHLAGADSFEDALKWFKSNEALQYREELYKRGGKRFKELLYDEDAMEQYLSSVEARIRIKTGGTVKKGIEYNPDWKKKYNLGTNNGNKRLRKAIATGKLDSVDGRYTVNFVRESGDQLSKGELSDIYRIIDGYVEDGIEFGKIKVAEDVIESQNFLGKLQNGYDELVNVAFNELMTKPNSYLSRSPVFKQNYWGWVLGNIGEMNKKTQTKFIKDARAAKIPKQFIEEMVSSAKFKAGKQDDFELLSTQAKGFGLAATKQLLYDASKKHKLSDITRNIFPFPEVWFELTKTWSKLLMNNPYKARQAHLAVESLRNTPNSTGVGGWIMPDPGGSGNEMFVYPGTGMLTKMIYGEQKDEDGNPIESDVLAAPMGYVSGLNLLGQGFVPGVMPHVGMLADKVLPKTGMWNEFRGLIYNDFGPPQDAVPMPSWFQKFRGALDGDSSSEYGKLRASTTMDIWRYGKAVGRDKVLLQEGKLNKWINKGYSDEEAYLAWSNRAAGKVFVFRGLSQFFAPTGWTPKFYVEDSTGELWAAQVLADEYTKILKKNKGDDHAAYNEFLTTYGIEHPWLTNGKSQSKVGKIAQTTAVQEWQEKNKDKLEKFDITSWYLFPDNPYDTMNWENRYEFIKQGDILQLTPEEYQRKMNDTIGFFRYKAFERQAVAAGVTGRALQIAKGIKRDQLVEQLPGYLYTVGTLEPISSKAKLKEIEDKWFGDEFAMSTQAGQGLQQFWPSWELAKEVSTGLSDTGNDEYFLTSSSPEAVAIRLGLNQIAIEIGKEYPDFAVLYLGVFQKLYRDDLDMIRGN